MSQQNLRSVLAVCILSLHLLSVAPTAGSSAPPPSIMALGLTGAGKSYLMNRLTGTQDLFKEGGMLSSETSDIKKVNATLIGSDTEITFIDTPGFFDNRNGGIQPINQILDLFRASEDGITLALYCIQVTDSRLSLANMISLSHILKTLGKDLVGNLKIVLTQADRLKYPEAAINKYKEEVTTIFKRFNIEGIEDTHIVVCDEAHMIECSNVIYNAIKGSASFTPKISLQVKNISDEKATTKIFEDSDIQDIYVEQFESLNELLQTLFNAKEFSEALQEIYEYTLQKGKVSYMIIVEVARRVCSYGGQSKNCQTLKNFARRIFGSVGGFLGSILSEVDSFLSLVGKFARSLDFVQKKEDYGNQRAEL